ncbi:AraC family transcriptional regulator [Rhizobium subbaraonis]|jgi:AraC family transcriptional regulator|uniref:AraC family transcriptional regulator n=1 Tax=Rhizobium subbaraonis TaxID=908946 RepID=A0A285V723_9HYPH|nr:AraC family transcriptional regulator [Rhizobium subbaraonis]SOC48321.1 AraC family transcriptional regulator [Rhizobium subbaraonis]
MEQKELLDLRGIAHPPQRLVRTHHGFSVEYVRPELAAAFSYDWTSNLHFCAYHDIVLEDGAIRAGDGAEDTRRDLRDTLTYVPRGARVSGWSRLSRRKNSFTAIYFDPLSMREELGVRFAERVYEKVYYRSDDVERYMRQWARLLAQDHPDSLYEEALGLVTILAIHRTSRLDAEAAPPIGKATLALVEEFIEENLGSDLTLSALAEITGLSRFHFSRSFKAATGETPHQHVLRRRMERAKLLLASGEVPIGQVSESLGFRSIAYFQKSFKSWVGMSVKDFRGSK